MASKEEVAKVLAIIKTVYTNSIKDEDIKSLAQIWEIKLKPYDDKLVGQALSKCLEKCKFSPTLADMIQEMNSIKQLYETSDIELWDILIQKLKKVEDLISMFNYTFIDSTGKSQGQQAKEKVTDIFETLPDKLKIYVGTKGELIRLSHYDDKSLKFERNRFLKSSELLQERQVQLLQNKENGFLVSD